MLADEIFEKVSCELTTVLDAHLRLWDEFDITEAPDIIYSSSYQDGLIHAFERVISLNNSGYYSHRCNITASLRGYDKLRKTKLKAKKYIDVAYIDGYMNGLLYLVVEQEKREGLPLYYVFGAKEQMRTPDEFAELRKHAFHQHKSAYRHAAHVVQNKNYSKGMIVHHTPFLM